MVTEPFAHTGPGDRIMVVVAHPDDAEFMCSGSVAKWTREGREAVYVLVTSGDKGTVDRETSPAELARLREREQQNACSILGVAHVEFLRYEDGVVQSTLELRKAIVRMIRTYMPSAVVTEDPTARWRGNYVNHPDHRAVGDATMDAVFPSARDIHVFPELYTNEALDAHVVDHLYLGASGTSANFHVDISSTLGLKVEALKAHRSQVREPGPEFDEFVRSMARRSAADSGLEFAEAFRYFYLGPRHAGEQANARRA